VTTVDAIESIASSTTISQQFQRTLLIAPHPDDDALAAGGLVQHVVETSQRLEVVFVTDGESNRWPQRLRYRKWRITAEERVAWAAMRRDEARCSLEYLGVPRSAATFLGRPDGRLTELMRAGDRGLLDVLRRIISAFQPTLIVSPSVTDLHDDHRATAHTVHLAALSASAVPIVTYVVHGDPGESRRAFRVELTRSQRERKRAAIACHRSQLVLSRRRFLAYADRSESFNTAEYDLIETAAFRHVPFAPLRRALWIARAALPRSAAGNGGRSTDASANL
jgi:LmbE family N-acetylglucosaminyl deacetylase